MPDRIQFEPLVINRDTRAVLETKGHVFAEKPGNMGDAEGVMIDPKNGMRLGASETRSSGVPLGISRIRVERLLDR